MFADMDNNNSGTKNPKKILTYDLKDRMGE